MNAKTKIVLYIGLSIWVLCFGLITYGQYAKLMKQSEEASKQGVPDVPALKAHPGASLTAGYSKVLTLGALTFAGIIGFGILVGHDVSQYLGNRAVDLLYNEDADGISDPDYEQAEQEWANGNHLEAIRLMREYLNKNPREQHAALRIAEIYEKDLHNYLAAALEYEEVLKHKLSQERWGWAAIHLCNLYYKLNQPAKAVELLRRIDSEYPETAAAEKARKRLGTQTETTESTAAIETAEAESPGDQPKLPPGFLPRKS